MNNIILLQIISLVLIVIIAIIVVYQFGQQQQALNRIDKMLNPQSEPKNRAEIYSNCLQKSWPEYSKTK